MFNINMTTQVSHWLQYDVVKDLEITVGIQSITTIHTLKSFVVPTIVQFCKILFNIEVCIILFI